MRGCFNWIYIYILYIISNQKTQFDSNNGYHILWAINLIFRVFIPLKWLFKRKQFYDNSANLVTINHQRFWKSYSYYNMFHIILIILRSACIVCDMRHGTLCSNARDYGFCDSNCGIEAFVCIHSAKIAH